MDGTLVFLFEQWTKLTDDGETIKVDVGASSAWFDNTVTDDFYAKKKDGGKCIVVYAKKQGLEIISKFGLEVDELKITVYDNYIAPSLSKTIITVMIVTVALSYISVTSQFKSCFRQTIKRVRKDEQPAPE